MTLTLGLTFEFSRVGSTLHTNYVRRIIKCSQVPLAAHTAHEQPNKSRGAHNRSHKRFCTKCGEVEGGAIFSRVRKTEIMRTAKLYSLNWNYYEFLKPIVGSNTLPMSRVCHNRSFLLTLTLNPGSCVMTVLVPIQSTSSRNPIEIMAPIGSRSGPHRE